jgi:cold-inducible RNA-binding protein
MPVRLFVGNLPYDVTEPDLREFFAPVGPLSTVIIPVDRETGKRRGFAFVEFSDAAQAEEASRRLNNQSFKGRTITINEARARESRPDSGPGMRTGSPMRSAPYTPRPGFGPRPSIGGPDFSAPNPMENGRAARAERRSRNFGADAKPARKAKPHYGAKGEMGRKKGPLRERTSGRLYGGFEGDEFEDDNLDLDDSLGFEGSEEEEDVM